MRDNFPKAVRDKLAKEAGGRCANPKCRRPTMGAKASDETSVLDLGEAAHICAASPGGARYDENQTPEQRKDVRNGIYLCRICARAVDEDTASYPVDMLRRWKDETRQISFLEATRGQSLFEARPTANTRRLAGRIAEGARADIQGFMAGPRWPTHPVKLNLHLLDGGERSTFDADSLAAASSTFNDLIIVAPPGTGKSTSLIQIVAAIIETQGIPAALVRLSAWASSGCANLFDVIASRQAFRGTSSDDLRALASDGSFCLALDGWNELSADLQPTAGNEISELRRQYPQLRLILSTRRQALQVPLDGPTVELAPLTDDQQVEIAHAKRGDEGRGLVGQAWRTPGLRELVSVPFYLDALLSRVSGGSLPTTRSEALELLVSQHEADAANAAVFRSKLGNEQGELLAGIALQATTKQTTDLSEREAIEAVAAARGVVLARTPGTSLPEPLEIVDILVDRHCLVREDTRPATIAFQHQQIQEWYASRGVAHFMLEAVHDPSAMGRLKRDFLNVNWWEESVLFACEQLSPAGNDGQVAVAAAVINALEIDPLLAARMIHRSNDAVWELVQGRVMHFAEQWHSPGVIDRALRFMMTSGRREFSEVVWPFIANDDEQIQLEAIRAPRRFRLGVLGDQPEGRIRALPDRVRRYLLAEVARSGGFDGMQFATSIACDDPDTETRFEVIQALDFRGGDNFVAQIVERADDPLWDRLAKASYPETLLDPKANAKLQEMRADRARETETPEDILQRLLHDGERPDDLDQVGQAIASSDYPVKDDRVMAELVRRYPREVGPAVLARLEAGYGIPVGVEEALKGTDLTSDAPAVVERLLVVPEQNFDSQGAAAARVAGEEATRKLLQAYVEADAAIERAKPPYPEPLVSALGRYRDLLGKVKPERLVGAIMERSEETDPRRVGLFAGLISHAGGHLNEKPELQVSNRDELAAQLVSWADQLMSANGTVTRAQLAKVANALAKVGSPTTVSVLKRLLRSDLQKRADAKAERAASRRRGPYSADETADNTGLYGRAFAAIGGAESVEFLVQSLGDLEFGHEAAVALLTIWERTVGPVPAHKPFLAFSASRQRLLERKAQGRPAQVHFFARPILEVIERYSSSGATDLEQRHAFRLASIALAFPHGDDTTFCKKLLDLKGHRQVKLHLLISMVAAGIVLSADHLSAGVELLYEDAKTQRWLIEGNGGDYSELKEWLQLFAYCDRPDVALAVIAKLPEHLRRPWWLRSFVAGLGRNPSEAAEELLKSLSDEDPRFTSDYEWRQAVLAQGTVGAVDLLLERLAEEQALKAAHNHDVSRGLALLMERVPSIRRTVYERYSRATPQYVSGVLERAIVEAPDEEGIARLIERYAKEGRTLRNGGLPYALRHLALGERALNTESGWREIVGVPLTSLRQHLFAMTAEAGPRAYLAAEALNVIDELRDDYGSVESEPRHPDIESGRPWPIV